ncbi:MULTISPECIES: YcaO-like family protein [Staphylococcus]|uniref:YcaO-like family protein n=3 Tax=Bacteria TaxID=2 RepID=UPI0002087777|nr:MULTISPECIES: YcaO-like family protein [Staphylococcus]HCW7793589.1 YcaO-like family protein [Staphylococcus aureus]EGG95761.1 hypothetical protein SEVCU121_0065 [Staphylococcus warneri VCU121]KKI59680.1 hypothetical protein UF68_2460 [Staphylococcus warneri]MBF2265065.1 YcaO-like family protein [Staphylococcus warneri]MBF2267530.1 YcaO-like family protein [Staphylococcus warneri]
MIISNNTNLLFNTSIVFKRSLYKNNIKFSHVIGDYSLSTEGQNTTFYGTSSMLSAIGEFIERVGITLGHYGLSEVIEGFDLNSGKKIKIDKNLIYFTGKKKNDSCGLASHITSELAIKNGFLEFVERQSLIEHCIFKIAGKKIESHIINETSKKYIDFLKKFLDEILLFEISIFEEVPVVLSLGFGKQQKAIGLSAAKDLDTAIENSLEEMLQTFSNVKNKREFDDSLKKTDTSDLDLYSQRYVDISPSDFKDYYSFLFKSDSLNHYKKRKELKTNELIKKFYEKNGIRLYCFKINNVFEYTNTKIIKIYSPDGYPYMLPDSENDKFNKPIYTNVNRVPDYTLIPFP